MEQEERPLHPWIEPQPRWPFIFIGQLKRCCYIVTGLLGLLLGRVPTVRAAIKADASAAAQQQPTVLSASNGVPVVNIQTPNAAKISHNHYSQFDISHQGAILNNSSQHRVQSQLGGWIVANPWLAGGSARLILNEVHSMHPSQLRGYLEVAGPGADVVIANPAGISINGAGFINAHRVTLTTGVPVFNNGALVHYRVQGGTVQIGGQGLETRSANYTHILAQAVQVNGKIWAKDLTITTGAQPSGTAHSKNSPLKQQAAPAFALDVAQLGGMYAGKIRLVGTEAGIGMRNSGTLGASAGEVAITHQGWLVNTGQIQSSGNTTLAARERLTNHGVIYAQGKTELNSQGDLHNHGRVAALGSTQLKANGPRSAIYSTTEATVSAGVQSDGAVRIGQGTLSLQATDAITLQGQAQSGGDQHYQAQRLILTGAQCRAQNLHLKATVGNIEAQGAQWAAQQTLSARTPQQLRTDNATIEAQQLRLRAHTLSNVAGKLLQQGRGNSRLHVAAALNNRRGRITSNSRHFSVRARQLDNSAGQLAHTGSGQLRIKASSIAGQNGLISSQGQLRLQAEHATLDAAQTVAPQIKINTTLLSHRAGRLHQTGPGHSHINARGKLDNSTGSITSAGHSYITATRLKNRGGSLQTEGRGNLTLQASAQLDNRRRGQIHASGEARLKVGGANNQQGRITAQGQLVVRSQTLHNQRGHIKANQRVTLAAARINNRLGTISSAQAALRMHTPGHIKNRQGHLQAAQQLAISSQGLTNLKGVIEGAAVELETHQHPFNNQRGTLCASGPLAIRSGALNNDVGLIQATEALTLNTEGQRLTNRRSGSTRGIQSQSRLHLTSGALDNSAGFIGGRGSVRITSQALSNTQQGRINSQSDLALRTEGLNNQQGQIEALGALEVTVGAHTVHNRQGLIRANQQLQIQAASVSNEQTQPSAQGIEGDTVLLTVDELDNQQGVIRASDTLTLQGRGPLDNRAGSISAAQQLSIIDPQTVERKTQTLRNEGGAIVAGTQLTIDSAALSGTGTVCSQGDLKTQLQGDHTHPVKGQWQAQGTAQLVVSGRLNNQGQLRAGQRLVLQATQLEQSATSSITAPNTQVIISGGSPSTLTNRGVIDGITSEVRSEIINNIGSGRLYGNRLALAATTLRNEQAVHNGTRCAGVIAAREQLAIGAHTLINRNKGLIFSAGPLAVGGGLDSQQAVTGQTRLLNNESATLDVQGDASLQVETFNNNNLHFTTQERQVGPVQHYTQYQGDGSSQKWNNYEVGHAPARRCKDEIWGCLNTPEGLLYDYTTFNFSRTIIETQIATSDPAKLLVGGHLNLNGKVLNNNQSQVIVGGRLTGRLQKVNNLNCSGRRVITDRGTAKHTYTEWHGRRNGRKRHFDGTCPYTPTEEHPITLNVAISQLNTRPTGSGTQIAPRLEGQFEPIASGATAAQIKLEKLHTPAPIIQVMALPSPRSDGPVVSAVRTIRPNLNLPHSALFQIHPEPTVRPLIETDARFTHYKSWLSADHQLQQLEPQQLHQRLGDGFYEQQLVREQVAQLTGRRFLADYRSDEAQYRALLEQGVTYAKAWNLVPGIALSAQQMAQLTSDMVWLVAKEVTIAPGRTTRVLVPQLYACVKADDVQSSGALLSADELQLTVSGALTNQGTLAAQKSLILNAEQVHNQAGHLHAGESTIQARLDVNNVGGHISARDRLDLSAGQDLNVVSTTRTRNSQSGASSYSRTRIGQIGKLSVSNPQGQLKAHAGRNLNLLGAQIEQTGAEGTTSLSAGHNLILGTVHRGQRDTIIYDANNFLKQQHQQAVGTVIAGGGDICLQARNNIKAQAAQVTSGTAEGGQRGALQLRAGGNIAIGVGKARNDYQQAHKSSHSNFLSSSTRVIRRRLQERTALGSQLSGRSVTIEAGSAGAGNLTVQGSSIVGEQQTSLSAQNGVAITSAENKYQSDYFKQEQKSGLFSNGGATFSLGEQEISTTQRSSATCQSGSIVGSSAGNLQIQAGKTYQQQGSAVAAPHGTIAINAQQVDIQAAQSQHQSRQSSEVRQSGLTVSLSNPVASAAQTIYQMSQAARQSKDGRLQALAAGTSVLAAKNAYDALASNPQQVGGVNLSVSVGSSEQESHCQQHSTTAHPSRVMAGGDIKIVAAGAGRNSNLTVQGSTLYSKQRIALQAENDINLLASQSHYAQQSRNSFGSSGIGMDVGSAGLSGTARVSRGQGQGQESAITQQHSQVYGQQQVTLQSGADSTLKGAQVSGRQVSAQVGGHLKIESVQDSHTLNSEQQSLGASVSAGSNWVGGSVNVSQQRLQSDFASVTQQSGIKAGEQGFQVKVKGNTDLKGAVITSSQSAIDAGLNRFSTGTLTQSSIENHAEYSADSINLGGGYSTTTGKNNNDDIGKDQQGCAEAGGGKGPGRPLASQNSLSATLPIVLSASDSARSTTHSGISAGTLIITDPKKQQALTGKTAAQALAELDTTVSSERDSSNALAPIFDRQQLEAGFTIASALAREAGTFLENRVKVADNKRELAERLMTQANDPHNHLSASRRQALRGEATALSQQAKMINKRWGAGGHYRQITSALVAAASGNVTGSQGEFIKRLVVNTVQQRGVGYIGQLVAEGSLKEGSPAHAALQSLVAGAGAAASGQDITSSATGAAASSLLTHLFSAPRPDETQSELLAKRHLIASLVTGIAATSEGLEASSASQAALAAVDNNWLATQQQAQFEKEYKESKTWLERHKVINKWNFIDYKQDVLTRTGTVTGLVGSIMKLIADPETRQLLGEPRYHSLTERVELMEHALETGGAQNAFQFGQDMGELIWDTCTAVISTYGTVKGGAELAKVGFKLGAPGVRGLAASAANVATQSLNRAAAGSGVKAVKAPGAAAKGAELASKVVGKLATRAAVKPAHVIAAPVPITSSGSSTSSAVLKPLPNAGNAAHSATSGLNLNKSLASEAQQVRVTSSQTLPKTRAELYADLLSKGFTPPTRITAGGYDIWVGPNSSIVTIKPTGEVIRTQRIWAVDKSRKYGERQDYFGNRLPDQSHSTGHFVD